MQLLNRIADWYARRTGRDGFDELYLEEARLAYESIVADSPGNALDEAAMKRIRDYSTEVLGSLDFVPWICVYTAFRGEFHEGWIPVNYYARFVLPRLQGQGRRLADSKSLSRRILQSDRIPDLVYCVNGSWLSVDGETLKGREVRDRVFAHNETAYVKLDGTGKGEGVFKVRASDFDSNALAEKGNLVVQKPIRQAG